MTEEDVLFIYFMSCMLVIRVQGSKAYHGPWKKCIRNLYSANTCGCFYANVILLCIDMCWNNKVFSCFFFFLVGGGSLWFFLPQCSFIFSSDILSKQLFQPFLAKLVWTQTCPQNNHEALHIGNCVSSQ